MNMGERIKELRIAKNMKQSDLAEKSGISRVAVGNYERGDRRPTLEIANKIAIALGVHISELLGISSESTEILGEKIMNHHEEINNLFNSADLLNDFDSNPNSPLRNNNLLLAMLLNNINIKNADDIELNTVQKIAASSELKEFMEYLVYKFSSKEGE